MKSKFILPFIILLSLLPLVIQAQHFWLQNGGMEDWRRKQFRCCGRNVDLPVNWGTPEQSCGINFNKFVFLEEDTHNVHSGRCAALLYSDTSFFNDIGLQPGMLVYGGYQDPTDSVVRIGQPVVDYGLPIDSNPIGITFWLKMSHDLSDTFSYMYLLTRWDSAAHHRDTLAFTTTDIADTHVPMDQYFQHRAGLHYLHAGIADSLRMIFYGGRFGRAGLATNETWIDDIAFIYDTDTAAITYTTGIDAVTRTGTVTYPNPARDMIHVQMSGEVSGGQMELYDALGRLVSQTRLVSALQSVDVSHLVTGAYICRIAGSDGQNIYQAKVSIVR